MAYRKLNVPQRGMLDAYENLLANRGFVADEAQMRAARALQALYENLLQFKVQRGSTLKRLLSPPKPPQGVYFWGGVGRGKSFLMDCFYYCRIFLCIHVCYFCCPILRAIINYDDFHILSSRKNGFYAMLHVVF